MQDKKPLRLFKKTRGYSQSQVSDLGATQLHQAKRTRKITNNKKNNKINLLGMMYEDNNNLPEERVRLIVLILNGCAIYMKITN